MKAFVTGSTGLLGSNLVRQLLEQGHEVKALARSPEKALKQLGSSPRLEVVKGDMEDISGFANGSTNGFASAMQGCDVLFHVAAYFRESFGNGDHWPKLEQINVKGTITLLDEAEKHGVKKVIYVSSSGVIGQNPNGGPSDESTPPDKAAETNLYFKSKVLAEQAVATWLQTHALLVVLILPTWMFGPQDAAPTAAGDIVITLLNKGFPAIPPGGTAAVDARDVAAAMIAAVDKGRSGERYIVSGSSQTVWNIAQTVEKVSSVPAPKVKLPYPVAIGIAWVAQTAAALQGKESLMTVSGIRTLNNSQDVNDAKARRELGHTPRPFDETIRDTVRWYLERQPEKIVNRAKVKLAQA
jgi:dihydroflavonol-4-reductase